MIADRKEQLLSLITHHLSLITALSYRPLLIFKAAPEQVRHLDEERATVAAETVFKAAGKWAVAVEDQVVVIAYVKRRAGIRSPAQEKLPANARRQRVVIHARTREGEPCELVCAAKHEDVFVESDAARVAANQMG